jgi:hypothetical protein
MLETLRYDETPFMVAERDYVPEEAILVLGTATTDRTDPRRIQVTGSCFILPPKLLYHSCKPNAYIDWQDMTLRADNHIAKDDVVTYHYGTSELDYSVGAFLCKCGSSRCVGYFSGFLYMQPAQQTALYPRLSPYIQARVQASKP